MPVLQAPPRIEPQGLAGRRAVAAANARWFRALAWRALRDGHPNGALRAANARAAAWIVIRQAQRDALVRHMARAALGTPLPPRQADACSPAA
ncbi:hypothetical protein F6X51_15900 [Methylobacterium planeticum]|uniref:Uncharacterized protein n=1 Tax=Methylobacterium planeticum TaxID=2615211 RepID=A0A6N6MMC5_9HYPH|nr:hypothetical protein F6X51_15900 [Methylobacterium planeticum]